MKEQKAVCPVCGKVFELEDHKLDQKECPECGNIVVFGKYSTS